MLANIDSLQADLIGMLTNNEPCTACYKTITGGDNQITAGDQDITGRYDPIAARNKEVTSNKDPITAGVKI